MCPTPVPVYEAASASCVKITPSAVPVKFPSGPVDRRVRRVVDERDAEHRALPLELALDLDAEAVLDDPERSDRSLLLADLLTKGHFDTSRPD